MRLPSGRRELTESGSEPERAVILYSISCANSVGKRKELVAWLKAEGSWEEVTPREQMFLVEVSPLQQTVIRFTWKCEATLVLLWALGVVEELHAPQNPLGLILPRLDPVRCIGGSLANRHPRRSSEPGHSAEKARATYHALEKRLESTLISEGSEHLVYFDSLAFLHRSDAMLLGAGIHLPACAPTSDSFQRLGQINLISSEGNNRLECWNRFFRILSHGSQGISRS